ncbi:MAG: hypothetical protein P8Z80_12465, partial [Pseudolabrys sp.]
MEVGREAGAAVGRAVPFARGGFAPATAAAPRRRRRCVAPVVPTRFPELDCIAGLLPPATIAAARERAAAVGIGADRVLPTAGHL